MPLIPLKPPRSNPRARSRSRHRRSPTSTVTPPAQKCPPPPPPPPIPFDPIIARAYGPTVNIYKDIFRVSSDAYHNEFYEAYYRVRKKEQLKLDKVARELEHNPSNENNALLQKKLMLRRDATLAAYQIVINPEKRKRYDKAIGLASKSKQPVTTNTSSTLAATTKEKKNPNKQEYVKDLFEDDEIFSDKLSIRRKISYSQQLQTSVSEATPMQKSKKLPFVTPRNNEKGPHDEAHELTSPLHQFNLTDDKEGRRNKGSDEGSLNCHVNSPTAVTELLDESLKAEDDNEASYTSLHASGRKQKSTQSQESLKERRKRKNKLAIDKYYRCVHNSDISDEESFAYEDDEEEAEACVDLVALYLNSCPCAQGNDNDDDSVLYD